MESPRHTMRPPQDQDAASLEAIGGEPVKGSGFENETPDPDFTDEEEEQSQTSEAAPP